MLSLWRRWRARKLTTFEYRAFFIYENLNIHPKSEIPTEFRREIPTEILKEIPKEIHREIKKPLPH